MALKELLVKQSDFGESIMEEILRPYVQYVENGQISFKEKFHSLKAEGKVAIALIAKDGWRYIPEMKAYSGGMNNEELERVTLLRGNTLRPAIKKLRDTRCVDTQGGVHSPTAALILWARKNVISSTA